MADSRPREGEYHGPEYLAAVAAPAAATDLQLDPWQPPRLYRFVVWLVKWLVPILYRVQVVGVENLPPPPYIVASNHQAWYDVAFLAAAFPAVPMMHSMANRDTIFDRRWKRALAPRLGVFPISLNRADLDPSGVAAVYRVLAHGGVILMFPEGRYSQGRELLPLKKGIGHFALEAGVPIVPVALEGVDRLRLRGRVEISIGAPIRPRPPRWWTTHRRVIGTVESVRQAILTAFKLAEAPAAPLPVRMLRRASAILGALRGARRNGPAA
ncbi:MAG: lysophospholipid acyltransferase family protein [Candidatus Dormibacteraceae bacterium]